jgi:hypothetical protein
VAAAPETPTLDYFQAHLTPYGQWVSVPEAGSCWVPAQANDPLWRPYMDGGHWEYTDAGWFWQSDYPWGDISFHYGRWIRNAYTGDRWAWVPGYDWAPSWVAWRYSDEGYLGWAPLPWGAEFRPGFGLYFHGALAVDIDFGLGFDAFVFVGCGHFWEHDFRRFVVGRDRARYFFAHSAIHNGYRMEGGRFHAEGLGRDRMREITHHEIVAHDAREMRRAQESRHTAERHAAHPEVRQADEHRAAATRGPSGSRGTTTARGQFGGKTTAQPKGAGSSSRSSSSTERKNDEK